MFSRSIGFVGGGRIARILLGGWDRAELPLSEIVVSDPDSTAIERLKSSCPRLMVAPGDPAEAVGKDVVFVAVHPPVLPEVLTGMADNVRADAVVISLAPKFTVARLATLLNGFQRIARMIPNAPSIVGRGYNPIAWGEQVSKSDREVIRDLLAPLGESPEVAEDALEAYAIVTAMGPTYFWSQWVQLVSVAESFNLSSPNAIMAVRAMLEGAVATLFDSGMANDEVLDLIPVKPLAELEPTLRDAYQNKLAAVMEKIRPQP